MHNARKHTYRHHWLPLRRNNRIIFLQSLGNRLRLHSNRRHSLPFKTSKKQKQTPKLLRRFAHWHSSRHSAHPRHLKKRRHHFHRIVATGEKRKSIPIFISTFHTSSDCGTR